MKHKWNLVHDVCQRCGCIKQIKPWNGTSGRILFNKTRVEYSMDGGKTWSMKSPDCIETKKD
jgi:hypothetical protein